MTPLEWFRIAAGPVDAGDMREAGRMVATVPVAPHDKDSVAVDRYPGADHTGAGAATRGAGIVVAGTGRGSRPRVRR